eukprot:6176059-Pleurochrysis_carterae.AAC.2
MARELSVYAAPTPKLILHNSGPDSNVRMQESRLPDSPGAAPRQPGRSTASPPRKTLPRGAGPAGRSGQARQAPDGTHAAPVPDTRRLLRRARHRQSLRQSSHHAARSPRSRRA